MPLSLSNLLDSWLSPAPEPNRVAFLKGQPYAHRGLHGKDVLENSPAAFAAAIAQGHGIECDVQAAEDGTAFVFHDYELERLTEQSGTVARIRSSDLDRIELRQGHGKIPRLRTILEQVKGQVPILIEVKSKDLRVGPICLSVRRALEGYRGAAAVMSFNPLVSRWFRKNAEHIMHGLVVTEEGAKGLKGRFARHRNQINHSPCEHRVDLLKQIKGARNITIAIIEHDMHVVFSLSERITVLAQGTPLVEDTPDNIKGHPKVREAYLGESA